MGEFDWVVFIFRALVVVCIVLAIAIDVNLILAILRLQERRYQKTMRVELRNLGNTTTPYQLRVEETDAALVFLFDLEEESEEPTLEAAPEPPQKPAETKKPGVDLKQAQQTAGKVRGASYFVSNLLGTLASILPNSMAGPLRSWAGKLRQQQAAVSRVERAPRQATSRAREAGRGFRIGRRKAPATAGAPRPAPAPRAQSALRAGATWRRTPAVEPGEMLNINLWVRPAGRPHQAAVYPFVLLSRAVGPSDPSLRRDACDVHIEGVSWLRHALPFILFAGLVIVEVALLWCLLTETRILG